MICKSLRSWELICLKTVLISSKNFLNFRMDMIEKQVIINLSKLSSKSNTSALLGYSKIAFLCEGVDAPFYLFLYCVLVIYSNA